MLPLYRDPHFTFRFDDDRIISRFQLEGVEPGTRVTVFAIDPMSGERLGLIATAVVGDSGWVDLLEPIIVSAGSGFIAVDWATLYGPEWNAMNGVQPASVVLAVGSEIAVFPKG